jgi:hypothetical protein
MVREVSGHDHWRAFRKNSDLSRVFEYMAAGGFVPAPGVTVPASMYDFLKTPKALWNTARRFTYKSVNTEVLA